jgi:RimJ/RimL family protein N-acetyltransferase
MRDNIEINTERLKLRPIRLEDAKAIFEYRADPVANRYQGWIPKAIDEAKDFVTNRVASEMDLFNTWFQFALIEKDSNKLIGDIGIHFFDADKKQVGIGYTLDKNYQGKGYMTEALIAAINYIFIDLDKHRITASIDPDNIKSIKLVEKLGFRKEGHFKKSFLANGQWIDDLVFAILKEEWLELNKKL